MDEHVETPSNVRWTQLIRFRNPEFLPAVITQMFIILASALVILGLIYIVIIVVVIIVHHFLYDRDPAKVPDYVKRSVQFSSEEEDSAEEQSRNKNNLFRKTSSRHSDRKGPSNAKKVVILDKFLTDSTGERPRNKQNN